jgi:hypothetical protein
MGQINLLLCITMLTRIRTRFSFCLEKTLNAFEQGPSIHPVSDHTGVELTTDVPAKHIILSQQYSTT